MKKIVLLLLGILVLSCTDDENLSQELSNELNNEKEKIENTTILIGKILTHKEVKREVLKKIEKIGAENSSISLSYLLNSKSNLMKNELEYSKNFPSKNLFKDYIVKEILSDKENYSNKIGLELKDLIEKNSNQISNEIVLELASQNLQIFYPSDLEYAEDDLTVTDFYMTYQPLEYADVNNAFMFEENNQDFIPLCLRKIIKTSLM